MVTVTVEVGQRYRIGLVGQTWQCVAVYPNGSATFNRVSRGKLLAPKPGNMIAYDAPTLKDGLALKIINRVS